MAHSTLITAAILYSLWVSCRVVEGHGRLLTPPSRSSMWRFGFKTPPNYNDMELFCGGFTRQWSRNGGLCGVCGDPWDAPQPRDNEEGGLYAKGIVVQSYTQGQSIEVVVELTAHHKGYFEFRVCPANQEPGVEVTQPCLDQNQLQMSDGSGNRYYLPEGSGTGKYYLQFQLPSDLHCPRCVFQWIYTAGNNWGKCEDGSERVGCGPQEQFRGCSDIAIQQATPYGANATPRWVTPTTTTPTTTTTTTTTTRPYTVRSTAAAAVFPWHTSPSSAGVSCSATGLWRSVPGMTVWCSLNCHHTPSFCPPTHCLCQ